MNYTDPYTVNRIGSLLYLQQMHLHEDAPSAFTHLLQARSDSQLHPDWKQSVHFVCTSLEQWSPECKWDDDRATTLSKLF